jgi:hypothetical protein
VVKNASIPESVLSKNHNAINYHAIQEAVANIADLFTKPLIEQRRITLLRSILYNF